MNEKDATHSKSSRSWGTRMNTLKERRTKFLEHLDSIFGFEPDFISLDSFIPDAPKVVCMIYRDVPEAGCITGVTHGLSEVDHPEWRFGRPELTISVDSIDAAWPMAIAHLVNDLRGKCPFSYGDILNFGEPVSKESPMSSFFLFVPSILEKEQFLNIDVGADLPLSITGAYPLYDSERAVFSKIGLKQFWHHPNFDLYSLSRPAVDNSES